MRAAQCALPLACALLATGAARAADSGAGLHFARHGTRVARETLATLRGRVASREVRVFEPYEQREVRFEAFDFAALLDAVYGPGWRDEEELLFTCSDGYQPTLPVARALQKSAWLAFARRDRADFTIEKFESGAARRVEVGPFYLVWDNLDDASLRAEGDYGWPYQVVGIDLIRVAERFPKMTPAADAPADVHTGFGIFRMQCSRCHAIDGEGGTLGPDLVTPYAFVDARDDAWLRRWIDDPASIAPATRMPRLDPHLPERSAAIDALIAYLRSISAARKAAATAEGGAAR